MAKSKIEIYRASRGKEVKAAPAPAGVAAAAAAPTPFTIEVRFLGGLTPTQKKAFKLAADRWTRVIVGDLPSVLVDGEVIDDLLILANGAPIDGTGLILGQAGPTRLRPSSAGAAALLPAKGQMTFDTADLAAMQAKGTLNDVICHEMGHVLGIGTIWPMKGLLNTSSPNNPTFEGTQAKKEFGKLAGGGPKPVPVENTGGAGTRNSHWRETVFRTELMTGFVSTPGNPMSAMTVASLADLGYKVDITKAEPYKLPNLLGLAVEGVLAAAPAAGGIVLPSVPIELPDDSLKV